MILYCKREYAFVEYDNIYSASEAIGHLNNTTVRGTRISVEESKPRGMKERRETKKGKVGVEVGIKDFLS